MPTNKIDRNTLKNILANIQDASILDDTQNLVLAEDEITEMTYLISNISGVILQSQSSDKYYYDLGVKEILFPLTRLNYVLSKENGALAIYKEGIVERCLYSVTFEEFLLMDSCFEPFFNYLHQLESHYEQFNAYIQLLTSNFNDFQVLQKKIVDDLTRFFDPRFAQIKTIYQHYDNVNNFANSIHLHAKKYSAQERIDQIKEIEQILPAISDNTFILRGIISTNLKLLAPFYVILNSLKRVERNFSLLVGELQYLKKMLTDHDGT